MLNYARMRVVPTPGLEPGSVSQIELLRTLKEIAYAIRKETGNGTQKLLALFLEALAEH